MNKIVIIGLVLIAIIISIIFMIRYTNNNIKDKGGMVNEPMNYITLEKVTYSISGDSIGSYTSKEMQHFDDYDLLTVFFKSSHNDEGITKEYKLANDTLSVFKYVLNKYNYQNWKSLPQSDSYALDAGTLYISIKFSNNESYSINQYQELPKGEEDLFETVLEFLNENNQTTIK